MSSNAKRKISLPRLFLSVIVLLSICLIAVFSVNSWINSRIYDSKKPWFAPYVDVTTTPIFHFEQLSNGSPKDVILGFVVSSANDVCSPSWGGYYSLSQAAGSLDLDRRIARLQQQGGSVAVSFGGLKNNELALGCKNYSQLMSAYQDVINRYKLNTVDFDIEGPSLNDNTSSVRRAQVIASIQRERRLVHKNLAVWLTLPVTPDGLNQSAINQINDMLGAGVDLSGINILVMDYGNNSLVHGQTMLSASENAVVQTERQVQILYKKQKIYLSNFSTWLKIGATPMIGQNDNYNEVFSLNDAKLFNQFAVSKGIGRLSIWSENRDVACGGNYLNLRIVSNSCSGVTQSPFEFSSLLKKSFSGSFTRSSGLITASDVSSNFYSQPDNPATSPYQIWSPSNAYLEGTKVVWHHNVYQAKWWTQGDVPDNPVLQTWQTPWQLIGPVLPGEKPISQPTLPAGTYPDWSGSSVYNTNDRVLFNGVPYQAKWWNQGDSPAAASSNPDSSPWAPLTQAQINQILATTNKSGS